MAGIGQRCHTMFAVHTATPGVSIQFRARAVLGWKQPLASKQRDFAGFDWNAPTSGAAGVTVPARIRRMDVQRGDADTGHSVRRTDTACPMMRSISSAGRAPVMRVTSRPSVKTASVGIERMA